MKANGTKIIKLVDGKMREYTLYSLIDKYADMLKTPTQEFNFSDPPEEPYNLAMSLAETMIKLGGIGLSANQVGIPYRIFSLSLTNASDPDNHNVMVLFNPKVIETSEEVIAREEGCLSYPGLYLKVSRPKSLTLSFQTPGGAEMVERYTGLDARIALHELDHLNGKLFTDSVGPVSLARARGKIKRRRKALRA